MNYVPVVRPIRHLINALRPRMAPSARSRVAAEGSSSRFMFWRDRHIRLMAERSRIGWRRATGYGRRNHAETTMGRYKHLIGPRLRARTLPGQRGEVAIAVNVLNRMIRTGKPVAVRAR